MEKGIISLKNPTFRLPNENPDDVDLDRALDLPRSDVVSVAKNDQLNNPVSMRRKVKAMYKRKIGRAHV